jgi:hypothetical protein
MFAFGKRSRSLAIVLAGSMLPRFERAFPVLVAITVGAAVTAGFAIWVLPDRGESGQDSAEAIAVVETLATATSTATVEPSVPPPPTRPPATATATPTRPPESSTPRPSIPTPTAPPSRTPVVVGDILVVNGGFSDGLMGWYVEGTVTIVPEVGRRGGPGAVLGPPGGYADQRLPVVSGRLYRLAAWGGMAIAGERGEVGIIYRDAAGNRLAGDDVRLMFDQAAPVRRTLTFIPPEAAATVVVYLWKTPGEGSFVVDDVSVREILSGATPIAGPIG